MFEHFIVHRFVLDLAALVTSFHGTQHPATLGDAIEAVNGGAGAPSWCSNPYLELGEHNAAVLSRLLGYDAGRIAALEAGGVLHSAER